MTYIKAPKSNNENLTDLEPGSVENEVNNGCQMNTMATIVHVYVCQTCYVPNVYESIK